MGGRQVRLLPQARQDRPADHRLAGRRHPGAGRERCREMTRHPEMASRYTDHEAIFATERPHLLEHELAQRWRLSVRTLQRWRGAGSGPSFLHLGRRVAYRLSDVERFETAHLSAGDR